MPNIVKGFFDVEERCHCMLIFAEAFHNFVRQSKIIEALPCQNNNENK